MKMTKKQMRALPIGLAMRVTTRPVLQLSRPMADWRGSLGHRDLSQAHTTAALHSNNRWQRGKRVLQLSMGYSDMYHIIKAGYATRMGTLVPVYVNVW